MLPPPAPAPDPFAGSGRRAVKQWVAVAVGLAAITVAVLGWPRFVSWIEGDAGNDSSRFTQWRWEPGTCTADGWEGRLYNLSDRPITGKLWAAAFVGDLEADRDSEAVFDLPANGSQGVSFVWALDEQPTRCLVDGFDLSP